MALSATPVPAQEPDASLRSALVLRALEQNARTLAEDDHRELVARNGQAPARTPVEIRRRIRNKSAFVSRRARRHYAKLLEDHVQRTEAEVQASQVANAAESEEIQNLRLKLRELELQASGGAGPSTSRNDSIPPNSF